MKIKFDRSNLLLKIIMLLSLVVAIYSALTYGRASIHSDSATSILLARCQVENISFFPKSWCYANGDLWVLSQNLIAIPLTYLFQDQSFARALQSVIWFLIAVWVLKTYSKKCLQNSSWLISTSIFLLFLKGEIDMILFQTAYTGGMMFTCLALIGIGVNYDDKIKLKHSIVVFALFFLLSLGGIRNIAEYTLPICGAVIILWIEKNYKEVSFQKCKTSSVMEITKVGIILVGSFGGLITYKVIEKTHILNQTVNSSMIFVDSLNTVVSNLSNYIKGFFGIFGFDGNVDLISINGINNIISISICLVICFVLPYLQLKKIKLADDNTKLLVYYGVIHNLIMFIMIVFTGKIESNRYILTSVFVCILISSNYIMECWLKEKNIFRNCILICYSICVCIASGSLLQLSNHWNEKLEAQKVVSQELEKRGLYYGVATYWNAYSNVIYSNCNLKIAGITIEGVNKPIPYRWLVDNKWFDVEKEYDKSFILLTEQENDYFIANNMMTEFGEPIESFGIQDDTVVYVFDYNIMKIITQ